MTQLNSKLLKSKRVWIIAFLIVWSVGAIAARAWFERKVQHTYSQLLSDRSLINDVHVGVAQAKVRLEHETYPYQIVRGSQVTSSEQWLPVPEIIRIRDNVWPNVLPMEAEVGLGMQQPTVRKVNGHFYIVVAVPILATAEPVTAIIYSRVRFL